MTTPKPGDTVRVAPNDRPGDCCQGQQATVLMKSRQPGCYIVHRGRHQCPYPRSESELTLVSPQELAEQYFEIEGWNVYEHYLAALSSNALTLDEISTAAKRGHSNARHFLALLLAESLADNYGILRDRARELVE